MRPEIETIFKRESFPANGDGTDTDVRRRLIHQTVPLENLPADDAEFYAQDAERSAIFVQQKPARDAYFDREAGLVVAFTCIDEREQDFEPAMGIPLGAGNVLPLAGSQQGPVNFGVRSYLRRKIMKAHKRGKVVIALVVTHESRECPDTDSCAAWGHDSTSADQYAERLVAAMNHDYVDRDRDGSVARRHLIAFRLKSITDTEARIWFGVNGKTLDPSDPIFHGGAASVATVDQMVTACVWDLFPYDAKNGFSANQWQGIVCQIGRMVRANIDVVAQKRSSTDHPEKVGHKGTRALIGRGWDMYPEVNCFFRINDWSPDVIREAKIAYLYLVRNAVLKVANGDAGEISLPFHVNVLYDPSEPGDRSNSIGYAMDIARHLQSSLMAISESPGQRSDFDAKLREALRHEGVAWESLPGDLRRSLYTRLEAALHIYISVSSRETRALELVATTDDL